MALNGIQTNSAPQNICSNCATNAPNQQSVTNLLQQLIQLLIQLLPNLRDNLAAQQTGQIQGEPTNTTTTAPAPTAAPAPVATANQMTQPATTAVQTINPTITQRVTNADLTGAAAANTADPFAAVIANSPA